MADPAQLHLTICQYATFVLNLTWKDSDDNVYDLSSYSADMQVRETAASVEIIVEVSTGTGEIVLGSTSPNISVTIGDDVTGELTPQLVVYDMVLEAPDGTVTRLIEGQMEIRAGVTREEVVP